MNRKRDSWIQIRTPKLNGLHRPLARNEIHQGAEVTGEVAKRPGDQSDVLVEAQLMYKSLPPLICASP